ncbi:MAG: MFS transporter [Actinomycetota bacterium]|nr:MFS transporter [Actinomycetota bacterium]
MNSTPSPPPGVDYDRKWLVMAAVSMGVILATIDASIVNVAFPTLVEELDTSFNVIQWVALGYLLTIATLTLGMGRLGDVIGKKSLYASGFAIFTVASALCGLAPDVGWLIGFRVVQAMGAVLILALGSAILVEAFPPHERGKALGWIGTAVSLGIITGPVLGGLLISAFEWRAIFFVNIPVGIFGTWLAIRNVPKTTPVPGQRFDIVGAVLMSVSLFAFSLALTLGQEQGFASLPILSAFAIAAVTAVAFVFVELRVSSPMIELRLFRNLMLTVSVITGFLVFAGLSATFFLLPFYLDGVLGFDVRTMGLLLGAAPLMVGVVSPMSGSLSDRIGIRRLTLLGLVIMTVTYFGFLTLSVDTTIPHFVALAIPLGIGIAVFQSPNNSAIMGSVPREYIGLGGGLLTITRLLGQISGIAVLGSVWAAATTAAAGGVLPDGGASATNPAAQVVGMHTTFLVVGGIMTLAVIIGAWGRRRSEQRH